MKNNPEEILFDCPKCQRPMRGDKALLGQIVNCPDCGESFIPTPHKLSAPTPTPEMVSAAAVLHAAQLAQLESRHGRHYAGRAEKIHRQALRITAVAVLLCVVGLVIAGGSAFVFISGGNVTIGFIVAMSLIGASAWLYLIAQIVHIRANTEK